MRGLYQLALVGSISLAACGGSAPPPEQPETAPALVESKDDIEQTNVGPDKPATEDEGSTETADAAGSGAEAEPEFKEGMSVKEAIDAVPTGTSRLNIEQEALSRPLMDEAVYEPCKLGNRHFKLKVAVWDGKAVGVDVTTTPKNDQLAECIKNQVRQLTWKDKVKSLNTVEYQL